jgi:chloride channel protein, CIC family
MALLLVLKLIGVTTSYASGNAGGIFGPSLFIGAMLGGSLGTVAHNLFPTFVAAPGVYALVGMGAVFAGIVRAPMTSVVMIFEMTRNYAVIVPLMISNLVSLFISSRLQHEPIYEVLAHQDGIHLPKAESRTSEGRRVSRVMRPATEVLDASLTERKAIEKVSGSRLRGWPVLDTRGVVGVITRDALEKAAAVDDTNRKLSDQVTAQDFPHLHSDQSLNLALERMSATHLDVLPVVSRANIHELEGILTLQDVLDSYGFSSSARST